MNELAGLFLRHGFHENEASSLDYKVLIDGNLEITICSSRSEITFDLTRKSGYTTPIIRLLSTCGLVGPSVCLIHENFHPVDITDPERINEARVAEIISRNWTKVLSILFQEYLKN